MIYWDKVGFKHIVQKSKLIFDLWQRYDLVQCEKSLNDVYAHVQISGLYYDGNRTRDTLFSMIEGKLQECQINTIQMYNMPTIQVTSIIFLHACSTWKL